MAKPKELFWVDMKLSPNAPRWGRRAGIRGGKRSSERAAREARRDILRFDPNAQVDIYKTTTNWEKLR